MATVIFLSCPAFGAKPIARDDFVTIDEDTSVLVDVLEELLLVEVQQAVAVVGSPAVGSADVSSCVSLDQM